MSKLILKLRSIQRYKILIEDFPQNKEQYTYFVNNCKPLKRIYFYVVGIFLLFNLECHERGDRSLYVMSFEIVYFYLWENFYWNICSSGYQLPFYYNYQSKESVWEKPKSFDGNEKEIKFIIEEGERIVKERIYIPQWWRYLLDEVPENSTEAWLSKWLLPLPIDHRYNEDDMGNIVSIITKLL